MTPATPAPPTAPTLTLAEAVEACRVSRSTLQRRKSELVELGAVISPSGWAIPVPALVQLGLLGRTTPPDTAPPAVAAPSPTPTPARTDDTRSELADEVARLRAELAEAQQRAAVAEAVAAERKSSLDRADRALLMLEATKPEPAPAPAPAAAPQPVAVRSRSLIRDLRRTLLG